MLYSILIFTALTADPASFGCLDRLGALGWSVLGDIVGGVGPGRLPAARRERARNR